MDIEQNIWRSGFSAVGVPRDKIKRKAGRSENKAISGYSVSVRAAWASLDSQRGEGTGEFRPRFKYNKKKSRTRYFGFLSKASKKQYTLK